MFEHKPKPPNSLLKFMSDLYSSQQTSGLLYTNDARVLIDIVLRQITDLSAHDQVCHSHSPVSIITSFFNILAKRVRMALKLFE